MSKKKNISLKAHLWIYFCTFAVSIIIILWILQIFFLNTFFKRMKLHELEKVGEEIHEKYEPNKDDFYEFWFEHSYNSGIFAHIISENGEIGRNFNTVPNAKVNPQEGIKDDIREKPRFNNKGFLGEENLNGFISRVKSSGSGTVAYIEQNKMNHVEYAVYGLYLGKMDGEKMYLYLSSPLERTDTTRKVLQTQLIVVTAMSVILALILAYFIAKRLSKPIEKITESAHELAKGDYDVHFEHGSYLEINELADALNHTAGELSKTENLRRDLISNVSHDLRTPLTIIKSYAEMIRDLSGSNEEKRNKHTGVIIDETNRLSLLVNDMLDLSRIQSGTMQMCMKPFNINETVTSILDSFEFYRESEGYSFEVNAAAVSPVMGDERRIEQAIYNLIGNAINYTGDEKKIFINVTDTENGVRFSVKDTGKGIPADETDLVWERYYKASNTHRRQTVGTGIGLSIVKNILTAHDAKFGVISSEGCGSEFWFELKKA